MNNPNKRRLSDLAVFGGNPAFAEKLYVGRPNIGNRTRLLGRFNEMLDRKWLSNQGPFVQELEERIAEYVGVKHCVATCNGTVGMEIAATASGLTGEVIVPSMTFVATAHALKWLQITPVFCDIDPRTHNIDPNKVESLITPRTTGIVGVHLWGRPCEVEQLERIAQQHRLILLFDAAHAFGCSRNGRMIGGFGDAEVFSFHATKFFNSFEGGAVVTNNDELAHRARLMKNFGLEGPDLVVEVGTNGKMSEPSAAMALTNLESLEEFIAVNYQNYRDYCQALESAPGISVLAHSEIEKCNYHYIVLEVEQSVAQISRDLLVKVLAAENVSARRYFYPGCHRAQPYLRSRPDELSQLPETERLVSRVLVLPNGTCICADDIRIIGELMTFVAKHGAEVTRMLQAEPEAGCHAELGEGPLPIHDVQLPVDATEQALG
jgi:dTDP-4-amino-4,6-dideoxygalactose transaminase